MGRRSLMLMGLGGMFVFYAVMTISFRYEVRTTLCEGFTGYDYELTVNTDHSFKLMEKEKQTLTGRTIVNI